MRLVVKLGGSHADSPMLRAWLRATEAAAGDVVVVPGGGPFADAVRAAQTVIGFDDAAADAMARLGMVQFGLALVSLGTRCGLAETEAAIAAACAVRRVPVWAPRDAADRLPRSWDVTSDSIAAALAARLGAALLLVKRVRPAAHVSLDALARADVVDRAFPALAARLPVWIAGPDDCPVALDAAAPPGVRVAALVRA